METKMVLLHWHNNRVSGCSGFIYKTVLLGWCVFGVHLYCFLLCLKASICIYPVHYNKCIWNFQMFLYVLRFLYLCWHLSLETLLLTYLKGESFIRKVAMSQKVCHELGNENFLIREASVFSSFTGKASVTVSLPLSLVSRSLFDRLPFSCNGKIVHKSGNRVLWLLETVA